METEYYCLETKHQLIFGQPTSPETANVVVEHSGTRLGLKILSVIVNHEPTGTLPRVRKLTHREMDNWWRELFACCAAEYWRRATDVPPDVQTLLAEFSNSALSHTWQYDAAESFAKNSTTATLLDVIQKMRPS